MVVGYSGEGSGLDWGVAAESDVLVAGCAGARCGYAAWRSASGCAFVCASGDVEGAIGMDVGATVGGGMADLSSAESFEDQSQPIVIVSCGV